MGATSNLDDLVRRALSLMSSETAAALPMVEAMPLTDRAALVRLAHANVDTIITNWDAFAEALVCRRGFNAPQVQRKAKELKEVLGILEIALALEEAAVTPGSEAEKGFNAVIASLQASESYLREIYSWTLLSPRDFSKLDLGVRDAETLLVGRNDYAVGPQYARRMSEADLDDVLDSSGSSFVH